MLLRHSSLRLLLPFLAGMLALWLGGCADSDRLTYASELDEPNYREGQSLLKAGRRQEALTAFLKVIDRRREDAPESHLEIGLLYAQHINDPLSAIYHFRKYLAQRPNSQQAPLVRQRIDAAIRDFARTIPAQPIENQAQRVDLIATLDRLKQENEALKQQIAEIRATRSNLPVTVDSPAVAPSVQPAPSTGGNGLSFSLESVPTVRTRSTQNSPVARPTPPAPTLRATPPVTPPKQTATPAASARTHIVRPGDTLSKLAQQYYNDRAKWRDIYAANRGVMKSEGDLRVGMAIKIP